MTKAEKNHLNIISSWGCLICGAPAEIHHPRFAVGMSQRSSHWMGVPLCPVHHRLGGYGQCVHDGYQEFRKNYMSEEDMVAEVIRRFSR